MITASASRAAPLDRTLRSLADQTVRPDEVIVVQLGTDSIAEACRPHDVTIVSSERTEAGLALGAARNLGVERSTAEQLIFLDVDCLAAPDLVGRYVDVLIGHPGTLACGPVRYLREGWPADAPTHAAEQLTIWSEAHPARPQLGDDRVEVDDRHELFWSLSFAVDRQTWSRLGGFDEQFVGYGAEDTDLALRARSIGIALAWFGGGVAFHQWHRPTRLDPARTSEIVANARRFRDRWGTWPMTGWLRELHDLGRIEFDEAADHVSVVPT